MKKLAVLFTLILVGLTTSLKAQDDSKEEKKEATIVEVIATDKKDKLVLHKTQAFKKTKVEIRYSNNDFVGYVKMKKNKLEIDFSEVKPGTYTVVVLGKDNHIQEFHYTKE